jgi:hypothetical protein
MVTSLLPELRGFDPEWELLLVTPTIMPRRDFDEHTHNNKVRLSL